MKKIYFVLLFLLTSILATGFLYTNSSVPEKLIVHYYRFDSNYQNFNIWLWENQPTQADGIKHDFDVENISEHGVYLEVNLKTQYPNAKRLGIIIKQGEWSGYREVGGDRFIDIGQLEVKEGVAHVYFVEQELVFGKSDEDLENNIPDYRGKILEATFTKDKEASVYFSETPLSYEIFANNVSIWKSQVSKQRDLVSIADFNLSVNYEIQANFKDDHKVTRKISIEKLYDTDEFEQAFTYSGILGSFIENNQTTFRLWAPISSSVYLNLYNQGHPEYNNNGQPNQEIIPFETVALTPIQKGAWEIVIPENLNGKYYTFTVTNGNETHEVTDPYAFSTGANGLRGLVVDFSQTNPTNWQYDNRPNTVESATDYIVYELHVRDLTTHSSWNGTEANRGKFLGLAESGTTYSKLNQTITTGLDHIVELGVNAVQLLPIFDFGYVDEVEAFKDPKYDKIFNWGYMPYHFNTLEGSYSTNPFDGFTRINEFKHVINAFHKNDIRVIMDVVYNHTGESETSNFNKILPGYYHRLNENGSFSNGSGTGNETASERSMMRKFMIDSISFWATEYNMSGFRFDLMALHDVETMNQIKAALNQIDPTIIVYGEPWSGGSTPLDPNIAADKENLKDTLQVGAFNDELRDAVKGSVFIANEGGFIQGNSNDGIVDKIKYGIAGGVDHSQVNLNKWHLDPNKIINYVEAHDNNTLHDKLRLTGIKSKDLTYLQIQANAIVLTAQGVPFLHAGAEFLRSKPKSDGTYDEDSYESPDSVNQMRWDLKFTNLQTFEYYKTLIAIRHKYPQLRMDSAAEINERLTFLETSNNTHTIAFKIAAKNNEAEMIVIHSGNNSSGSGIVDLTPGKTYQMLTAFDEHNINGLYEISDRAIVVNNSTMILVEKLSTPNASVKEKLVTVNKGSNYTLTHNINYLQSDFVNVSSSSYYDLNTPGYYTITVRLENYDGYVLLLNYTLRVRGNKYKVNLIGGR